MSIRKRRREIEAFVQGLCADFAIEERGSGHIMVWLIGPAGRRSVTISSTPSDGRAYLNAKAQVRRLAREIGHVPA